MTEYVLAIHPDFMREKESLKKEYLKHFNDSDEEEDFKKRPHKNRSMKRSIKPK